MLVVNVHIVLTLALMVPPSLEDVVRRQYEGDPEGALEGAEQLVKDRPGAVAPMLALTCAAIEAGRPQQAASTLAALEELRPVPPRARVLRYLLERRSVRPEEPFIRSLASSWRSAGRPDLSADEVILGAGADAPLPALSSPSPAARLVLDPAETAEARARLAIAASQEVAAQPAVVSLQILGALAHQPCGEGAAERNLAAKVAAERASAAFPGNGYVVLAARMAQCPGALSAAEVTLLEQAARLPRYEIPRTRMFEEIQEMALRMGPASSMRRRIISAWLQLDVAPAHLLRLADEGSLDVQQRRRVGAALESMGLRLADAGAWLDRFQGLALAKRGTQLLGDPERVARAERRSQEAARPYWAWERVSKAMGRWPFAAELREWTPGEAERSLGVLEAAGYPSP